MRASCSLPSLRGGVAPIVSDSHLGRVRELFYSLPAPRATAPGPDGQPDEERSGAGNVDRRAVLGDDDPEGELVLPVPVVSVSALPRRRRHAHAPAFSTKRSSSYPSRPRSR